MMCWVLCAGMAVVMGGQVLTVYLVHRWLSWTKAVEVPWFASLSRFINPGRK